MSKVRQTCPESDPESDPKSDIRKCCACGVFIRRTEFKCRACGKCPECGAVEHDSGTSDCKTYWESVLKREGLPELRALGHQINRQLEIDNSGKATAHRFEDSEGKKRELGSAPSTIMSVPRPRNERKKGAVNPGLFWNHRSILDLLLTFGFDAKRPRQFEKALKRLSYVRRYWVEKEGMLPPKVRKDLERFRNLISEMVASGEARELEKEWDQAGKPVEELLDEIEGFLQLCAEVAEDRDAFGPPDQSIFVVRSIQIQDGYIPPSTDELKRLRKQISGMDCDEAKELRKSIDESEEFLESYKRAGLALDRIHEVEAYRQLRREMEANVDRLWLAANKRGRRSRHNRI